MSQTVKLGPGTLLADRYELTEMIGRGGFGAVWRARQLNMDRDVAIKILPPQFMSLSDVVERFKREAKLASRLRHPNTITLHDYGKHKNLLYIVMELLTGEDLADVLRREGKLPPERIIHVARQVLKSLSEAHEQNIVHRDLKPENIYLSIVGDDRDYVKVLDFGIAKLLAPQGGTEPNGRRLTMSGSTVGTPTYMSPEQAAGEDVDPLTDLYALGIIMYECLNGRPPFNNKDPIKVMRAQLFDPVPPLRDERYRGSVLDRVIQKALQKDPGQRFQSASDMLLALAGEAVARPIIRGLAMDGFDEPSIPDQEFAAPNTDDFEPRFESTLSFVGSMKRESAQDADMVPFGVIDAHADTVAPTSPRGGSDLNAPGALRSGESKASVSSIITVIPDELNESEEDPPPILLTRKKDDTSEEQPARKRPEPQTPARVGTTTAPLPPSPNRQTKSESDSAAGSWGWDPSAEIEEDAAPLPKRDGIGFWIVLGVLAVAALAAVMIL